ncbi:MAG TPA: hypothetical protein VI139_07280, partial [Gemmatimonadales bacterium]
MPGVPPATREPDRPRAALRQLVGLRTVAIVAQVCLVLAAVEVLDVELPIRRIFAVLTALALFNGWACYRLRARRPVTDLELLLQLIVDMVALTAVL